VQSSSQITNTRQLTLSFLQARCPSCRQPTVSKPWRQLIEESVIIHVADMLLWWCSTEGDRKAYYEQAENAMKQNRQKIVHLQQENKDLYKQKAEKLKVCSSDIKLPHCFWNCWPIFIHFQYTLCAVHHNYNSVTAF